MQSDAAFLLCQLICRVSFCDGYGIKDQPFHTTEGGLGAPDEIAVTGDHHFTLLSVVIRNVWGFPVASG